MKTKLFILSLLIIFNIQTYSQDSIVKTKSIEDDKAIFDVHLAASLNNGLRLGSRLFLLKNFSMEISFGTNLDFFSGKGGYVIGFGINLYPLKKYSIAFNLSGFTYLKWHHYKYYYIISPNFGFLTSRDKGIHLHAFIGGSILITRSEYSNVSSVKLKPNVEIGFGIGF
jgi:hypothetical protein